MEEIIAYREDLLKALGDVVEGLSETVARLPALAWHQSIRPGESALHFILFHLRELEAQVYTRQLPRFLAEDNPTLPVFDDQAWMAIHYRPDEPAASIMTGLCRLRSSELEWLRRLPPTGWSRMARHPWWGVHTLQWWVELQLEDSFNHLKRLPALGDL